MWRGLYIAATGMITEARRTDVIANNLANAATTGYKKDTAVHHEFETMLIKRMYDSNGNSSVPISGLLDTDSGDVYAQRRIFQKPRRYPSRHKRLQCA